MLAVIIQVGNVTYGWQISQRTTCVAYSGTSSEKCCAFIHIFI